MNQIIEQLKQENQSELENKGWGSPTLVLPKNRKNYRVKNWDHTWIPGTMAQTGRKSKLPSMDDYDNEDI